MTGIVVDASVAVKWVVNEEHSSEARALLRNARASDQFLIAPPLFRSECTNAIFQQERRGHLTRSQADQALADFLAIAVRLITPLDLFKSAFALSRRYNLPATYDSQYLALALESSADFWTADTRLRNALPKSVRWVHSLADYGDS